MNDVATLLLETARRGELHHALILHGPATVVLMETATALAKTLNCLNGTAGDSCNTCQRIERRLHPDVHFIEVAGDRKMISIEQIREMVEGATMRPYEGQTKLFIVDRADTLSPSGSNALLKTLEEPTRDTVFLLLTRSPDLLLPTIRSRCQAVYLGGEVPHDAALEASIVTALRRFAEENDSTALLGIAALVAQEDDPSASIALLGDILCRAAAGAGDQLRSVHERIDASRLVDAADGTVNAIRWLTVNADVRLMLEGALSRLVAPR